MTAPPITPDELRELADLCPCYVVAGRHMDLILRRVAAQLTAAHARAAATGRVVEEWGSLVVKHKAAAQDYYKHGEDLWSQRESSKADTYKKCADALAALDAGGGAPVKRDDGSIAKLAQLITERILE